MGTSAQAPGEGKAFSGAKGKWRAFCPSPLSFVTASPNYIWSWSAGQLGQVNSVTGEVRLFTMLDGLPLDNRDASVQTYKDDRALLFLQQYGYAEGPGALFLWDPKDGWRTLPYVTENRQVMSACFDADGKILALTCGLPTPWPGGGTEVHEFVDGAWRLRRTVPRCRDMVAMKEGLALTLEFDARPMPAPRPPVVAPIPATRPAGPVRPRPFIRPTRDVVLLKNDETDASKAIKLGSAGGGTQTRITGGPSGLVEAARELAAAPLGPATGAASCAPTWQQSHIVNAINANECLVILMPFLSCALCPCTINVLFLDLFGKLHSTILVSLLEGQVMLTLEPRPSSRRNCRIVYLS